VRHFKVLGLDWAYVGTEPLWLPVYNSGLGISGVRKGYFYSTRRADVQGRIVASTEAPGEPLPRFGQIDENWYVYLDD
jgi:hypothetical protein